MSETPETTEEQVGDGVEEPRPSPESGTPGGEADEVAALVQERDRYLDLARRAQADFENYRKRAAQQATDAAKRARSDLAKELLPVVDSLERALEADPDAADGLAKGVALVRDQLIATLGRAGVEAYDPAGERFDPAWHEALSTAPAPEGIEAGTILEVLDRGYRIDGQVLRPARVVVSE